MRIRLASASLVLAMLPRVGAPQPPKRAFALEGLAPEFWRIVPRDDRLATVGSGFGFTEGPLWDSAGFLYVSDETLNRIFRLYPDGRRDSLIALGDPDGN